MFFTRLRLHFCSLPCVLNHLHSKRIPSSIPLPPQTSFSSLQHAQQICTPVSHYTPTPYHPFPPLVQTINILTLSSVILSVCCHILAFLLDLYNATRSREKKVTYPALPTIKRQRIPRAYLRTQFRGCWVHWG